MKLRGAIENIVKRIKLYNDQVQHSASPSQTDSETVDLEKEKSPQYNSMSSTENERERESNISAFNKLIGDQKRQQPLIISSTEATLVIVDQSLGNMKLFASRYIATIAIYLREFSISCDLSRFHLKLIEVKQEDENRVLKESQAGMRNSTGSTVSKKRGHREGVRASDGEVIVWVIRGLAFAGIGKYLLLYFHLYVRLLLTFSWLCCDFLKISFFCTQLLFG